MARDAGYSLTEVLVVLILMGFLSSVAMPAISSLSPSISLETAENQLRTDLNALRRQALSEGKMFVVEFESGSPHYLIRYEDRLEHRELPGRARFKDGSDRVFQVSADGKLQGGSIDILAGNKIITLSVDPLLDRVVIQ